MAYSLEYYVDEDIELDRTGTASIIGETNIDILNYLKPVDDMIDGQTPELTEKKDKFWLFDYEHNETLSSILIDLYLPKHSTINYIDTNMQINIRTSERGILINFFGADKPLKIKVQYSLNDEDSKLVIGQQGQEPVLPEQDNTLFLVSGLIILLVIIAILSYNLYTLKRLVKMPVEDEIEPKKSDEINHERINTVRPTLTETQIRIMDAILEKKGQCTQSVIHHMTNIPKSSLSRNIENLHRRNILVKFYNGTTNFVKLHPSFYK